MGWEEIKKQDRVVGFLREAVSSGRLPSAYLFIGPPGTGKKEAALVFSQQLLDSEKDQHPDRFVLAPEKTSIKIEQIRELLQRISLRPLESSRMVFIIEEAHQMTIGAANALLKILEEPPCYALFILLTSTPDLLPATVRSRCQKILFQPAPLSARDFSTLSTQDETKLLAFLSRPSSFLQVSKKAEEWAAEATLLPSLMQCLRAWWRDLLVYQATHDDHHLVFPDQIELIRQTSSTRPIDRLFQDFDLIGETERALEANVQKTLLLEHLFSGLTSQPT